MHPESLRIDLPLQLDVVRSLRAGQDVRLYGSIFTARDATHERLLIELRESGELPYGLTGQMLFYAGPTPARAGRPLGSVGPTTAKRMDAATEELMRAGVVATLGKGSRTDIIKSLCVELDTVYFAAVGGVAAHLAQCVVAAEVVAYPELGTEALMRLELHDFPAFVAVDSFGNDLYEQGPSEWRAMLNDTLE